MEAGSIVAHLDLDYNGFSRGLTSAKQQLDTFTDTSQSAGTRIQAIGGVMSATGSSMTKSLTVPLLAGGVAIGKLAMDYETSSRKVSTIADTTKVSMEKISKGVIDLSNKTGTAATDLNEALYQSISAGVDTASAVEFLGNATKLSKAGFADTSATVDLLTTVLNAYGMEASEVTRVSDILVQTQNLGKTSVGELSSAMGKVIPTANAYGVSLEQLSAAYVETTKNGIATSESTTYINSMLNELGKSGTKVSDVIKKQTGKSFQDLMKDGSSLGDVMKVLNDYAEASGLSLGDLFGSAEAAKAAMVLAKNAGADFNNTLKDLNSSAGSTDEAFGKVSDSSAESLTRAFNELKNAGVEAGESLAPVISDIAGGISELAKSFSSLDPTTQNFIINAGLVIAAIGPMLSIVGNITTVVGAAFGALDAFGVAIGLASGPAGWIVLGAGAILGLMFAIDDYVDSLKEAKTATEKFNEDSTKAIQDHTVKAGASYDEQRKQIKQNMDLSQEEKDARLQDISNMQNAEANMTNQLGIYRNQRMDAGYSEADATAQALRRIINELDNGEQAYEIYGMNSTDAIGLVTSAMIDSGMEADDLGAAINRLPKKTQLEVASYVYGKEGLDGLKAVLDGINSKDVYVRAVGYRDGDFTWTNYATGVESSLKGIAEVAEYGTELIVSKQGSMALATGRQLMSMQGGETVYNARQTKEILNNMSNNTQDSNYANIDILNKLNELIKVVKDSYWQSSDKIVDAIDKLEFSSDIVLDSQKIGDAIFPTINNKLAFGRFRG